MADQGLKAQLQFPLQLEVLLAQGIIMGIAIPLYLTRDTWYTLDAGPANIWMVLNWTGITLFLAMLLEFGFSLIDGIVRGSRRIPVFSFAFLTREIGVSWPMRSATWWMWPASSCSNNSSWSWVSCGCPGTSRARILCWPDAWSSVFTGGVAGIHSRQCHVRTDSGIS